MYRLLNTQIRNISIKNKTKSLTIKTYKEALLILNLQNPENPAYIPSQDEIKKAYRKRSFETHPDLVNRDLLTDSHNVLDEFYNIRVAYDYAIKHRDEQVEVQENILKFDKSQDKQENVRFGSVKDREIESKRSKSRDKVKPFSTTKKNKAGGGETKKFNQHIYSKLRNANTPKYTNHNHFREMSDTQFEYEAIKEAKIRHNESNTGKFIPEDMVKHYKTNLQKEKLEKQEKLAKKQSNIEDLVNNYIPYERQFDGKPENFKVDRRVAGFMKNKYGETYDISNQKMYVAMRQRKLDKFTAKPEIGTISIQDTGDIDIRFRLTSSAPVEAVSQQQPTIRYQMEHNSQSDDDKKKYENMKKWRSKNDETSKNE